jgi:hypothetical protein
VVDGHAIGHRGHGEPRHRPQRGVVVQALGERHRHVGQEALGLLGPLLLGDVLHDIDRHLRCTVRADHRACLDDDEALLAGGPCAEANGGGRR